MGYSEKINGYTKEEAQELINFIDEGKRQGKALSYLFASFGKEHGRAKGSVRNYYYSLFKRQDDKRVVQLLNGKNLSVEQIRAFTAEETDAALRSILTEKAKGMSVRKAIRKVAAGDEKLTLRLQNKYRNLLKKQPERVQEIAAELGISPAEKPLLRTKTPLQNKLEEEINALCERLTAPLVEENKRLKEEIERLKARVGE